MLGSIFFLFFSLGVDQAVDAAPTRLLGLHLFCRRDDSLLLGRPGSHALGEGPAPRWPIWGSVIHHTAGGHVLWKGHELVTSLGQPALCVKPIFLFLPPSAPLPPPLPPWPSPSQDAPLYWNNWVVFRAARLPVWLQNRDIKSRCHKFPLTSLSGLLPLPSSEAAAGHRRHSGPFRGTMTRHPWYIIYSGSAGPELYVWTILPPALLSRWSFGIQTAQRGTHSKFATSRGFYSSGRIQSLPALCLPLASLSLSVSVSPLSYSEFNEGEEIKGSLWFAPDDGEACLFCFCRRSHTASVHVKWDFSFFPFFLHYEKKGRWLRCLRKKSQGVWSRRGHSGVRGALQIFLAFFFLQQAAQDAAGY